MDQYINCTFNHFQGGNKTDGSNSSKSSTPQQHRGSKSRWSNKNGDHSPVHRKDDYRAQKMTGNNNEQNTKETNGNINFFFGIFFKESRAQ